MDTGHTEVAKTTFICHIHMTWLPFNLMQNIFRFVQQMPSTASNFGSYFVERNEEGQLESSTEIHFKSVAKHVASKSRMSAWTANTHEASVDPPPHTHIRWVIQWFSYSKWTRWMLKEQPPKRRDHKKWNIIIEKYIRACVCVPSGRRRHASNTHFTHDAVFHMHRAHRAAADIHQPKARRLSGAHTHKHIH